MYSVHLPVLIYVYINPFYADFPGSINPFYADFPLIQLNPFYACKTP